MKVTSKTFVLRGLIDKASSVLPRGSTATDVLRNLLIEATEDGLRMIATDLELTVLATTAIATVGEPGRVLVSGKKLAAIAAQAKDTDVTFEVTGGELSIHAPPTRWSLRTVDDTTYPALPSFTEEDFAEVERDSFVTALSSVAKAASTDTVRANLMLVDITDGRFRAADGARFQQVTAAFPIDIQIPVHAVSELLRLLRGTEATTFRVMETDDHLVFGVGDDVFLVNRLLVQFPNVDQVLLKPAMANDKELWVDRDDLVAAIKRVRVTADEDTGGVVLGLTTDRLTIRCSDRYGNASTEALIVRWNGSPREVAFQHEHLIDLVQSAPERSMRLWFGEDTKTQKSPVLLRDEATGLIAILNQIRREYVG